MAYRTKYYVILPHYTNRTEKPEIKSYRPVLGRGRYIGYDYIQGPFKTLKEAQDCVIRENVFRKSQNIVD